MKDKIKVGDTVAHKNNRIYGVVSEMSEAGKGLRLKGYNDWYVAEKFKVVGTSKYHKHHDSIIAWAKGAMIEARVPNKNQWFLATSPMWAGDTEYHIKPTEPTELELLEQKYKELGDAIDKLKENKECIHTEQK